jgi:hypothetical protein
MFLKGVYMKTTTTGITLKDLIHGSLINYEKKRNVETIIDDEDDEGKTRVRLYHHDLSDKNEDDNRTEDDHLTYVLDEERKALFFVNNYQMENLEDLPQMIDNVAKYKELINYISKEAK